MRTLLYATTVVAAMVSAAAAADRGRGASSTITACSRFGHGCITGAVRHGQFGKEVRMPNGTWLGCGGDCRDKLREETVDFWDLHRPEKPL